MKQIVTLVSSTPGQLQGKHVQLVQDFLHLQPLAVQWLAAEHAVDIFLAEHLSAEQRAVLLTGLAPDRIDCFFTLETERRKKLLIADMDNTMIIGETLDDLADHCGLKEKIAAITEQAMRGELDFKAALRERVEMLRGLSAHALHETAEMIQVMPGARTLIATMTGHGARCVLVSGGFTTFTEHVARQLGFGESHGNFLEIADGRLTGKVGEPIIDFARKLYYLEKYAADCRLSFEQTLAVGDGANDLAMLRRAGLGVGYHPKPILREQLANCVMYGDLTTLLYAQGYSRDEFARNEFGN